MTTNFRRRDFSDVSLYAVTASVKDPGFLDKVDALLKGGIDAFQLRTKELADRDYVTLAKEVKKRCAAAGVLFLVNNRADLALATDADGLHIGHNDLPIAFVRGLIGHRKIIGVSTHSVPEALEAQRGGADYVSCGPIWATPTKPEYKPVGLGLIGLYRAALKIPFVAIGGITLENAGQVTVAGATRIAVVRGLLDCADPAAAAAAYRAQVTADNPARA